MRIKILIISNACLNQSDSNGRTIARLLDCYDKEQKAQFYTYGLPDFNECLDYYHVSDNDALKSLLSFSCKDGSINHPIVGAPSKTQPKKKLQKSPLKMLIREFVWKHGCWNNKFFKEWIDNINPTCVLVIAGDNCFTLNIARKIAKTRSVPLYLYSTEEYPFKNYNFVTKRVSFFYWLWRKQLLRAYKKIEKYVKEAVFNSEALAKLYSSRYSYSCSCIYQSSNIDFIENIDISDHPIVSYLGNLGLNRHKALIDIADCLFEICPEAKLNIFGKAIGTVKEELEGKSNIVLHGFVPYEKVVQAIHSSTLLIHTEFDNQFYNRDLKYAFSTKIADCVCSGTPFLIYASSEYEETKFLKIQKCAFVVDDKKKLKEELKIALFDIAKRKEVVKNASYAKRAFFTNNGHIKKIIEGDV